MNPLDYWREKGYEVIEMDEGWANYYLTDEECYLQHVYVDKEFRKKGLASLLTDKVAKIGKESGCKHLTTTVSTKEEGAEISMLAILHYGFKFYAASEYSIKFIKEL